jgi:glucose-1-phosphate cytidylyltransferase
MDTPVVILCGGKGTRMREDGEIRAKPMVEVGGKPILWHIIQIYTHYGFREFILPLGFGGEMIRSYFSAHPLPPSQRIVFVETGENTLKGGRIKRVASFLKKDHFHLTYGDGVANVHLGKLHRFHLAHGQMATVTAVRPPSRFGELVLTGNKVRRFVEKPQLSSGNINGGFFVFRREFLDLLTTDEACDLEFGALQNAADKGHLRAYRHPGFWQCMDTPRERDFLNTLWRENAPWKIWKETKKHETNKLVLEA